MMKSWPIRIINFPIIMIAISQQLITGLALLMDNNSHMVTAVHAMHEVSMAPSLLPYGIIAAALLAINGFFRHKKIYTILCMLPQQLLLYIAAGGSFRAIWLGEFADGITRSHYFILIDQAPSILIAIFHTWGMVLIMLYGESEKTGKKRWFGLLAF